MVESAVNSKIQLNLSDPGMTWLHRAGMAGLWMTLKQLEQLYPTSKDRAGNLTWLLNSRSISLNWQGQDYIVLDWLLKQSFQISDEGLIRLIGLNFPALDIQTQIIFHLGITGTFLQHNKLFQSAGKESKSLTIDGIEILVNYKKAAAYAHQNFAQNLCDKQDQFLQEPIHIAGWLYPGAVMRHAAFIKKTKFAEKPEYALALLFAPVACRYFVLRAQAKNTQYVLVVPEVNDLEVYGSSGFWKLGNLGYKHFYVSSLGDAGLRALTYETTRELVKQNKVQRCQVILFATLTWSKPQKTRREIAVVEATEEVNFCYQLVHKNFPEYRVVEHKNGNFITTSLIRGIMADNLAKGLPWWRNFYSKTQNKNFLKEIFFENTAIYKMIQNSKWELDAQKLFVKACHEALRKIYAKIYSKAKENEYAQIERENIRISSQLRRCTNAENFRKFIAEFWGRAGQLSILQEHWEELLPMITGIMDWKLARDLTFIAIASYPKSNKTEAEASENNHE